MSILVCITLLSWIGGTSGRIVSRSVGGTTPPKTVVHPLHGQSGNARKIKNDGGRAHSSKFSAAPPSIGSVNPDYRYASVNAVDAWHDLKFGLRIHWGECELTCRDVG
jgi:hypothetical protein